MQEIMVKLLGQEDLLEKAEDTRSNIVGLPFWLSW